MAKKQKPQERGEGKAAPPRPPRRRRAHRRLREPDRVEGGIMSVHKAEQVIEAQRRQLYAVGSILSLLREVLDDRYANEDRQDAPDLSHACDALLQIVDTVCAALDPSALNIKR